MYKVRVSMEGFEVPDRMPRMVAVSDALVWERMVVGKDMGGRGYREVDLKIAIVYLFWF